MAARRAGERARRQFWAIARWQLLADGFSPARIDRWVAAGRLHPYLPGVYAWGRPELSAKGRHAAALLFAGSGSALTGCSALWWQKLLEFPPRRIVVDAPGRSRSRAGVHIRHPREINRRDHNGLPVVELARALLVASEVLEHDSLRLVLARADFEDLLSLPSLQAACARGLQGSRALRAAMDGHLPALAKCVNDFEREFVLLCERFDLPIPEPNERMGRYRPDMLWRDRMVIVELDGKGAHTSAAQKISDAKKQEWLESIGHTVIRFRWAEVYFDAARVAEKVRRTLAA